MYTNIVVITKPARAILPFKMLKTIVPVTANRMNIQIALTIPEISTTEPGLCRIRPITILAIASTAIRHKRYIIRLFPIRSFNQ